MASRTVVPASGTPGDWAGFARLWLAAAAGALLFGAGLSAFVDPLWVFRERPPWLGWTGGANRLLDVEMRRAKPLQLATRPNRTVLVGSSVVYRGLRSGPDGPAKAYNLGLSALMADELSTVAALLRGQPDVLQVVIGLDYFMFTDFPGPPRMSPDLATRAGRARAWIGAAVSLRALAGALPGALASAYEPGAWRYDGYKETPDYPPAVTARLAADERARRLRYRPDGVAHLRAALEQFRGLDVRLYLSPVSAAAERMSREIGRGDEIERWRADVAAAAASAGASFQDLSRAHPFDDFDPRAGSSAHWLDHLHFKPTVGDWVLRTVLAEGARP